MTKQLTSTNTPNRQTNMEQANIIYIRYPGRVIVCESPKSPDCLDKETNDLREYARIVTRTAAVGGVWITQYEFAGAIEWSKHASMLSDTQRRQIEAFAARYAEADKAATERAKALQRYQRARYADKAAKYGEY